MKKPSPTPDEAFMDQALVLARTAAEAEEVPVGAVLVRGDEVVAQAYNQVESKHDAFAHAEMLVMTEAQKKVGDWRLLDCTLYVTKEPCPMCAGAIIHTRLKRVVFGASDLKAGALGGAVNLLELKGINHHFEYCGGVREKEARQFLQDFFKNKRGKSS